MNQIEQRNIGAIKNILAFSKSKDLKDMRKEWYILFDPDINLTKKHCVCNCTGVNGCGLKYAVCAKNIYTNYTIYLGRQCQKLLRDLDITKVKQKSNDTISEVEYKTILSNEFYMKQLPKDLIKKIKQDQEYMNEIEQQIKLEYEYENSQIKLWDFHYLQMFEKQQIEQRKQIEQQQIEQRKQQIEQIEQQKNRIRTQFVKESEELICLINKNGYKVSSFKYHHSDKYYNYFKPDDEELILKLEYIKDWLEEEDSDYTIPIKNNLITVNKKYEIKKTIVLKSYKPFNTITKSGIWTSFV